MAGDEVSDTVWDTAGNIQIETTTKQLTANLDVSNIDVSNPTVPPHPQLRDRQRLAGLELQFYRRRLIPI
ncbi:MAG TPA: hypothetical protein VNO32_63715 [Candidatus Acidoferrum sp.]|nr:hypothetical protein [Candidatus Acidoferrum sp.]